MKKTLLTTLQIAITIALLYFVFRDPAKRAQMLTALQLANYWWIALGVVVYFGVEAAAAVRFGVLLRVQGIRLSNARVGALFFIGMFYNQFMPGGTGEVSFTEWGVQYWPVKLMMPIGAALLLLQGISKLTKDVIILTHGRA